MSYLNIKVAAAENKFNWDDIEVGNDELDHSQNFFGQKHLKHERLDALQEMEMVNELLASASLDDTITEDNKENMAIVKNVNNASAPSPAKQIPQIKIEKESPEDVKESKPMLPATPSPTREACAATSGSVCPQDGQFNQNRTAKSSKPPSNIAAQWSTQRPIQKRVVATGAVAKTTARGAAAKAMPPPPHAYEFKDHYQRRREEALQRRLADERKMREFHSRPVPNFKCTERRRVQVHAVTVPVTPQVLKKSRETEEKRKKRLEELKIQQLPKFEPRPAAVLTEEPFVPKKTITVLQPRPFKLNSEKRSQERKQFDSAVQRSLEEKQKQEEEERKKREEEHVKELRKMTTFKARPNPFK